MADLNTARRLLQAFRTLAAAAYDAAEADPTALINQLAVTVDNRTARETPVRLEQILIDVEAREHSDETVLAGLVDRLEYAVAPRGYDAWVPFKRIDLGRPSTVAQIEQLVPQIIAAMMRKRLGTLMEVFRLNPVSWDGQDFFDTDHAHQGNFGTFSNVVSLGFAAAGTPTFDEAKALIHVVRARFMDNYTRRAEVLSAGEIRDSLLVIVHNSSHWSTFELVRTQTERANVTNEAAGTFTLLMDARPTVGQENRIEFVYRDPAGARPIIYVPDLDPYLDAWEPKSMSDQSVAIGLRDAAWGVKPGDPVTAIQGRP